MGAGFTGERLHEGSERFGVDLARHRAGYEFARAYATGGRVLDLGCGAGHGLASIADDATCAVGIDRVPPDSSGRSQRAQFCRASLDALPLRHASFDLVLSFQVIEHLEQPDAHVSNHIAPPARSVSVPDKHGLAGSIAA